MTVTLWIDRVEFEGRRYLVRMTDQGPLVRVYTKRGTTRTLMGHGRAYRPALSAAVAAEAKRQREASA